MRFLDKEGKEYIVADEAELVHKLNETSHTPALTDEQWMRETAVRIKTQMGRRIAFRSAKAFVKDLMRLHLVNRVEAN